MCKCVWKQEGTIPQRRGRAAAARRGAGWGRWAARPAGAGGRRGKWDGEDWAPAASRRCSSVGEPHLHSLLLLVCSFLTSFLPYEACDNREAYARHNVMVSKPLRHYTPRVTHCYWHALSWHYSKILQANAALQPLLCSGKSLLKLQA